MGVRIGFDAKRAAANYTGLGNYSRFVISEMTERYGDNEYFLYVPKDNNNKRFNALFKSENVHKCTPRGVFGRKFSSLWRSRGIISDLQIDSIDLFHGLSHELPIGISKLGIPSVVTMHDVIFHRYPNYYHYLDRKIYDAKWRYACNNASRIVAISECTKRDIMKYYNVDSDKIDVVYQSCDAIFSNTVTEADRNSVRERYNLPEHYVLSVGSIETRKNTRIIVESLKKLPEQIHAVLVGRYTAYVDEVMQCATEIGVTDRIHLIHDVQFTDLPAIYSAAEVFAYPSRFEGFGIPIIEALSVGVPVIAATGSCLEEAGGPNSIYVSPDDLPAFTNAVERIFSDAEYRNSMIADGTEYVKRFSPSRLTDDMMAVYNKVLKR